MSELHDEQLPDLLDRIRDHRARFPTRAPEEAAAEFLRVVPRVPRGDGFLQIGSSSAARWVARDLIAQIVDREQRAAAIRRLFNLAEGLSERWRVLHAFGTWPESERSGTEDEPALDESATVAAERQLAEQIHATDPAVLAREHDLRSLSAVLAREDKEVGRAFLRSAAENDRLFLALAFAHIRRVQSSAPPFRRAELDTDVLNDLLGGPEFVARRTREIKAAAGKLSEHEAEALALC